LKRRTFLKFAALATILNPVEILASVSHICVEKRKRYLPQVLFHPVELPDESLVATEGDYIKDYLNKIRHPDIPHKNDIILEPEQCQLLLSVVNKFRKIQTVVGHGNFSIIGIDDALQIARQFPKIGKFTRSELRFLEMIYYLDAGEYGFKGEKLIVDMSEIIDIRDLYRVPSVGGYLFRGESFEKYERVKKDLGEDLVLTSGIRGITKQFYLFLNKARRHNGNLSLASRSLAPPGYSYHATGDFDVGQKGFGGGNFSEEFTTTSVFKKLTRRGFVNCRYGRDNTLGVRYEPWHIKI